jgi:hypothetical protein
VRRRGVLLGLLGAGALVPASALAGCGRGRSDPLVPLVTRARRDAAFIDAVIATKAMNGNRLAALAAARRQHADALVGELGDDAPPASAAALSPGDTPGAGDNPDELLDLLRSVLDGSRRQAAALVPTLTRPRAALVGSIAACCAAYRALLA